MTYENALDLPLDKGNKRSEDKKILHWRQNTKYYYATKKVKGQDAADWHHQRTLHGFVEL